MTVIGRGDGLANVACRSIWRTREASAHYGIDGRQVAQFLPDSAAAWATADFEGNHGRINVEHANSSGGPQWRISAETLDTGARLFAELHHRHNLGRPVMNVTIQRHKDFFPTACPGPWFGDGWSAFCAAVIRYYDNGNTNDGGFLMALTDKQQKALYADVQDIKATLSTHNGPKKNQDGTIARWLRRSTENTDAVRRTLSEDGRLSNAITAASEVDVKVTMAELSDADVQRIAAASADESAKRLGSKL